MLHEPTIWGRHPQVRQQRKPVPLPPQQPNEKTPLRIPSNLFSKTPQSESDSQSLKEWYVINGEGPGTINLSDEESEHEDSSSTIRTFSPDTSKSPHSSPTKLETLTKDKDQNEGTLKKKKAHVVRDDPFIPSTQSTESLSPHSSPRISDDNGTESGDLFSSGSSMDLSPPKKDGDISKIKITKIHLKSSSTEPLEKGWELAGSEKEDILPFIHTDEEEHVFSDEMTTKPHQQRGKRNPRASDSESLFVNSSDSDSDEGEFGSTKIQKKILGQSERKQTPKRSSTMGESTKLLTGHPDVEPISPQAFAKGWSASDEEGTGSDEAEQPNQWIEETSSDESLEGAKQKLISGSSSHPNADVFFEGIDGSSPPRSLQDVSDHPLRGKGIDKGKKVAGGVWDEKGAASPPPSAVKLDTFTDPSAPHPLVAADPTKFQQKIFLLDGDDPEGRRGGFLIQVDEKDLSPEVQAYLHHAFYLIEGKPTWTQTIVGGGLGTAIGVGVGNGMPPIFMASLDDLGPTFLDLMTNNDLAAELFISHTAISLGTDSVSRNVRIIGGLAGPSTEDFSAPQIRIIKWGHRGGLVLVYIGAGVAAILPLYYLWDSEAKHLKKHPEDRKIGLEFFYSLASTLWLDTVFMISRPIKAWVDQKFYEMRKRQAYEELQNYTIKRVHQQKLHQFQELKTVFSTMDDEEIRAIYNQIFHSGDYRQRCAAEYAQMSYWQRTKQFMFGQASAIDQETESQRILNILDQIYQQHGTSFVAAEEDSELESVSFYTKLGLLMCDLWTHPSSILAALATPVRGLVLWYVMDEILGSLGLPPGIGRAFLSNVAGQFVGSFFQGVIEQDTVGKILANGKKAYQTLSHLDKAAISKAVSHYFCPAEEKAYHLGWKVVYAVGRGLILPLKILWTPYLYVQGAWNTLPYMLIGTKVTKTWPYMLTGQKAPEYRPTWIRGLALAPYGFVDGCNNTASFQESYGDIGSFARRCWYSYVQDPSLSYMRERLINLAQDFHDLYQQPLHPDVIGIRSLPQSTKGEKK
jgi:hypothetical protein